jgi:uncharacterized membrane protein
VIPAKETLDTDLDKTEGNTSVEDGGAPDDKEESSAANAGGDSAASTDDQNGNENPLKGIPEKAVENIYINFLYVYILIIGFYFGSRVFEDFAGVRMAKELKDVDPVDLLKRRYAAGEISEEDYTNKIENLDEPADLLRMKLAKDIITKEVYEDKIEILEKPVELAFSFDKSKKTIRITNVSDKEISINDLMVDGIHAFDKEGKPLKGKTIGAKKHTDIVITIQGLNEDKNNYFIRLNTESGRVIKEAVVPIVL